MVGHVDSTSPRVMFASRARHFHVPRSFLVCVLSPWLTLSVAHALDPNKRLSQYAHTAWRMEDGFLPNTPLWVSQTKDGYLWVGGSSGALRFDGVRFTPWSAPIVKDFASPGIRRFLGVREGGFWISNGHELVHVKDDVVISHYDLPGIFQMFEGSDGSVWVLRSTHDSDRILCQATATRIRCFGKTDGITVQNAGALIPDGKGGFWIGGETSLLDWKIGGSETYSFPSLRSMVGQAGIVSLVPNPDGSLWVGISAAGPGLGLEKFVNGVLTPFVSPNLDGSKLTIMSMIADRDNNLWIATLGNGIYRIHGQTVDHFGRAEALSSDTVFNLYEGEDGMVWAATSSGIDNFRDLPIVTFSALEGLAADEAVSVMAARDGTVWVSNTNSLDFIRNQAVSSVRAPGAQPTLLLEDHAGNVWAGVDDGLFIYKDRRFRRIPEPDHRPLGLVVGITEDVDGNIWAECRGAGGRLVRIRDFKVREEFSGSQVPAARAIAANPKGGIWLSTLAGDLTLFRQGIVRTFPLKHNTATTAYQIAVEPNGSVAAAFIDGLFELRAGKVQRLSKENGLPCNGVTGFLWDDDKHLWLNTPCGFVELADSEVQRWRTHPGAIVQSRLFDTLDGARPGSPAFNPAAKTRDGRLWFVNGVVLQTIDPAHLSARAAVPPVYVEAVVADRKQYKPQEGLQLPPLTRDLQIDYTSPSFLIPQKVKFRYRLDGRDRDWQDASTRRQAFYTELGPGKYRFRVIACNSDGVWNDAGAIWDFSVAPAWYQTNWFRILCALSGVSIVWVIYRLRVLQISRSIAARFDERLAERTRLARDLHDTFLQTIQGSKLVADDALDPAADPVRMRRAMEQLSVWLGRATEEGRAALNSLRTGTTQTNDLADGLRRATEDGLIPSAMAVTFSVVGDARELHPIVRDEIYRIGYEAIRNACMHSGATRLEVELRYADGLALRVSDNGIGIDPAFADRGRAGHFGLQGMGERAARIGGKFTLESSSNRGTEIKLIVPGGIIFPKTIPARRSLFTRIRTIFR
jgi:signal transduction histidine kinase/ligand-binding sensor domain-containing protein